jgi:hypothetical protein
MENAMRNRFFADPPKAIGWRGILGHLGLSIKRLLVQVWQIVVFFEGEPKDIEPFPESDQIHIGEPTVKQCQWIFDQTEQRRNQLEQKAQSTFSLMLFLVPVLISAFVFIAGKIRDGFLRDLTIVLVGLSGLFILLAFIAAIRAVNVKSNQTLSLPSVIQPSGEFRVYSESFHAKGLLYCASMNTATNDHLAQFVRGAHSMTVIAVLLVIVAAVPTSFTAATQPAEVTRTAIVGTVQIEPPPAQPVQTLQEENAKLKARSQLIEQRLAVLEKMVAERESSSPDRNPGKSSRQPR